MAYQRVGKLTNSQSKQKVRVDTVAKKNLTPLQQKISRIKKKMDKLEKTCSEISYDSYDYIKANCGMLPVYRDELRRLAFLEKHKYPRDVTWRELDDDEQQLVALTFSPVSRLDIDEEMEGFSSDYTAWGKLDDMLKRARHYEIVKGLKFSLTMMTPDEYMDKVFWLFWQKSSEFSMARPTRETALSTTPSIVSEYAKLMKKGTKFPIPYLDYVGFEQEGRHRAMAAKEAGIEQIPVLMVFKYDWRKEESSRLSADHYDFALGRYKE